MQTQILPNRTVPAALYKRNTAMFAHWYMARKDGDSVVLAVRPDLGKKKEEVFFPCLSELRRNFS